MRKKGLKRNDYHPVCLWLDFEPNIYLCSTGYSCCTRIFEIFSLDVLSKRLSECLLFFCNELMAFCIIDKPEIFMSEIKVIKNYSKKI
ncbi:unnamed protein product [Toxocara canis]|uniref:Uncharacterized protein n=1 Tax=Toxocara canis TaxID=6265 RepID=A0A183U8C4_TOXCA|nr:unnamed protein product [Toxocara canis]